jgi:branched-chain amino acid transport system ATP-binding protein
MTALVELREVSAGYDGVDVLHGLSLSVQPGEVFALLGPNGAGKTTALLTIMGEVSPSQGEVTVLGGTPKRASALARSGVAFVPEERALFYDLTVQENLYLAVRGSRSKRKAAYAEALDMFPVLAPLLQRRAGLLSGGEQQILAVARAILQRPKLLMIDEMTLGLAPVIVEKLFPMVRGFATERGLGVLLVEQHVRVALEFADRALVLNAGKVVAMGTASEISADQGLLEAHYLGQGPSTVAAAEGRIV